MSNENPSGAEWGMDYRGCEWEHRLEWGESVSLPPHLILLISREYYSSERTLGWWRRQNKWKMKLCTKRIGGLGEMKYFWNTADVKDNIIKLNWVASLYTWKVSLKSKANQTLYQMIILISYALKYYIVLKIYPPEKWVRWHLLTNLKWCP